MVKQNVTPQEAIDILSQRLRKLEATAIEQEVINQIHESIIGTLILFQPEPDKLDRIWRALGADVVRDIVNQYASRPAEVREIVNKALSEHMNLPKMTLNEAISIREMDGDNPE